MNVMAGTGPLTLSVGETIILPGLTIPLPANVAAGVTMATAETRYTLTRMTFEGADRIAHLAMAITGGNSASAPGVAIDTRTTGEGTIDVNVERGIVLHREMRMTMDVTMHSDGSAAAMPSMRTHVTTTLSMNLLK